MARNYLLLGSIAIGVLSVSLGLQSAGWAVTGGAQPRDDGASECFAPHRLCQPAKSNERTTGTSRRFRVAQSQLDCFDRCFDMFRTCMGEPPRGGPPNIIPNGRPGGVPTGPGYEFCIRVLHECNAECKPLLKR